MDSQTEKLVVGDVVKEMFSELHCVVNGTLAKNTGATADLPVGQVLQASSTKYVVMSTGSSANGVLLQHVTKEELIAADVVAPILVRGPATVDANRLTMATGQETTAKAALLALGIVSRDEPVNYEEGLGS